MPTLRSLTPALALAAGTLFAACSSTQATVTVEPTVSAYETASQNGEAYTLMVLRTGDGILPSREELAELTTRHTAFVEEMTQEGFLLSSGPLVAPRVDRELRGLFFCDSADTGSAYARACADPATEAGAFTIEAVPFICSQNLRAIPVMERTASVTRSEDSAVARPYVVVAAPTSVAMDVVIEQLGETALFSGHCTGGSMDGVTLCVVNCKSADEARNAMSLVTVSADEFEYHPWVSTASLASIHEDVVPVQENDVAAN